jgi:hypothetical protein
MAWIEQHKRADGGLTARVIWRLGGGRDGFVGSSCRSSMQLIASAVVGRRCHGQRLIGAGVTTGVSVVTSRSSRARRPGVQGVLR